MSLCVIFLMTTYALSVICSTIPTIKLNNSASPDTFIPVIGLGTAFNGNSTQVYEIGYSAAQKWLSLGNRYFDEAHCYPSRNGVADGVLNYTKNYTLIPRSELFIVSKVGGCSGDNLGYNEVMNWFNDIITIWQTTYIDVILLHMPAYQMHPNQQSSDLSCLAYQNGTYGAQYNASECRLHSWKALIELYLNGSIKAIGVSNFESKHLNDLFNYKYENGKTYLPTMNQIQFHGYRHEYNLINFCRQYNIQPNSWSPLGAPDVQANKWNGTTPVLTQHPIAKSIAQKYNKSIAQIWLRWQRQWGSIPIPRSNNIEHMMENMDIFDFKLDDDDMNKLYNITAPPYYSNLVYSVSLLSDPNNLP